MSERLVVVTGGAGGIGRAVAARFEAAGDRVLAPGRDECDVTDEDSVAAFFERAGEVDVLVNNAGTGIDEPFLEQSVDHWQHVIDTNLTGPFVAGQRAAQRRTARPRAGSGC